MRKKISKSCQIFEMKSQNFVKNQNQNYAEKGQKIRDKNSILCGGKKSRLCGKSEL